MSIPNLHEQNAREIKCRQLARYILAETVRIVRQSTEEDWQNMAAKAGVNMPSTESQRRVIQLLEGAKI